MVDVVVPLPQYKSRPRGPSESFVSEEKKHRSVIMTFSKLSLALVIFVTISGLNAFTFQGENECKFDQLIKAKYKYNLCWVWSEYRAHKTMLFINRILSTLAAVISADNKIYESVPKTIFLLFEL